MTPNPFTRAISFAAALAFPLTALGQASASRAADAPNPDVTVMDKLIVEATQVESHRGLMGLLTRYNPWLYVEAPDYEVLSRCDSEQTLAATRHLADSLELDEDFVPAAHLAPLATPMSFIMFDHAPSAAMQALIPNTLDVSDEYDFGIYHNPTGFTGGGIDVCDSDTHCAVQNRWGMSWAWAGGGVGRGPIPTGLLFKMSQCAPALPPWYQYGFIGPCGLLRMVGGNDSMILSSATWVSEAETKAIIADARKSGTLPKLPPIEDLFRRRSGSPGSSLTNWPSPTWMAEAALFLRWGLYGRPAQRGQFETFIERSRREPVTDAMFRECFGFGLAQMQARLSQYLVEGSRNPVLVPYDTFAHWRPNDDPKHPPFPNLVCREATPAEIARILGDWERMEGKSKKLYDPDLSRLYLKRAGKTLNECYNEGEREPRFLAVLGLYDADVGDPGARGVLEEATKVWVARPEAYVALAQLYLEDAKEHPSAAGGRFGSRQVAAVLKPLFEVRRKATLNAAGYGLTAEAWSHSVERPALSNLAALREGLELYPFDSALILSAAGAYAQWGYAAEAGALIDRELRFADDATARQLVALKASLAPGR